VGVGVGVGITSQSKNDSKFKISQLFVGVGVGVKHIPVLKYVPFKSGQVLGHGDLPDNKQTPSNEEDRHHCESSIE
jgi:hypothetical protein